MARKRPTGIAGYIAAAASVAQPHLRELHALLKSVAPKATEAIKWGHPFFVEPRFLCAFSAHKAHVGFMCSNDVMSAYRDALRDYEMTPMGILKIPYGKPLPKTVIKQIVKARIKLLKERQGDGFW